MFLTEKEISVSIYTTSKRISSNIYIKCSNLKYKDDGCAIFQFTIYPKSSDDALINVVGLHFITLFAYEQDSVGCG